MYILDKSEKHYNRFLKSFNNFCRDDKSKAQRKVSFKNCKHEIREMKKLLPDAHQLEYGDVASNYLTAMCVLFEKSQDLAERYKKPISKITREINEIDESLFSEERKQLTFSVNQNVLLMLGLAQLEV